MGIKEIDALVLKALAKNPSERYRTAEELVAAVDSVGKAATREQDPARPRRLREGFSRLRSTPSDEAAAAALEPARSRPRRRGPMRWRSTRRSLDGSPTRRRGPVAARRANPTGRARGHRGCGGHVPRAARARCGRHDRARGARGDQAAHRGLRGLVEPLLQKVETELPGPVRPCFADRTSTSTSSSRRRALSLRGFRS